MSATVKLPGSKQTLTVGYMKQEIPAAQSAAGYAMVCRYDGDIDMVSMGYRRDFIRQRSSLVY
eukprot:scaffold40973_cov50-Attheya_sp.AAC.8